MFSFFKRKSVANSKKEESSLNNVAPNPALPKQATTKSSKTSSSKEIPSDIIYEDNHFKFYLKSGLTYLEIDGKHYSVGCKHPYDPISYISDDHGMIKLFRPGWYFKKADMSYLMENGTTRSITGRDLTALDMCRLLETIVNSEGDDFDIGEMERKTFS